MKCKHYKGDGYSYEISEKEILSLCDQCNLNLAGGLVKQLAIEVFVESMMKRIKEKRRK